MRPLPSRFRQGKWTNPSTGSGPIGTGRPRSSSSSSASSWWILEEEEEAEVLRLLLLSLFHPDLLLLPVTSLLLPNLHHQDLEFLLLHQECKEEIYVDVIQYSSKESDILLLVTLTPAMN